MQVFGEEGMLHVRSWDSIEVLIGDKCTIQRYFRPDHGLSERVMSGMVAEVTEMVDAVRQGRQPSPSGEDGRTSVALVLATYNAAERGSWIEIPGR